MVSDANKPSEGRRESWCLLRSSRPAPQQLARKEPAVLTAAAGVATAHYTSIRWSEGSSVSLPAAGAGSVGGDKTESTPTVVVRYRGADGCG